MEQKKNALRLKKVEAGSWETLAKLAVKDGEDLYNPEMEMYVFPYNEDGAVCMYRLAPEQMEALAKEMAVAGEQYVSSALGTGGQIFDRPESLFKGLGWRGWYEVSVIPAPDTAGTLYEGEDGEKFPVSGAKWLNAGLSDIDLAGILFGMEIPVTWENFQKAKQKLMESAEDIIRETTVKLSFLVEDAIGGVRGEDVNGETIHVSGKPWHVDAWYDEDIIAAMVEGDIPVTQESFDRVKKHVVSSVPFDTHSEQNEQLAKLAKEAMKEENA